MLKSAACTWLGCVLLLTVPTTPSGNESNGWGAWSEPSPCSRSCGGGVQYRWRTCNRLNSSGSPQCIGQSKTYISCNIEDCPGKTDFRKEQCQKELASVLIDGRRYVWEPHFPDGADRCELHCRTASGAASGQELYRSAGTVVDGTSCDRLTDGVCVGGVCQRVGCDKLLGSKKRFDNCMVCGGNGSSCTEHRGIVASSTMSKGYNRLIVIPAGATTITVQESSPSQSRLAARSQKREYYLTGKQTDKIGSKRVLHMSGSWFVYKVLNGSRDFLTSRGPLHRPLVIEVVKNSDDDSIINYDYYLPLKQETKTSRHPPSEQPQQDQPQRNSGWLVGDWGSCSVSCGNGVQSRLVTCPEGNVCNPHIKPAPQRSCRIDGPCPEWEPSSWSECDRTCGDGTQQREVECVTQQNGNRLVLHSSLCDAATKPPTIQQCTDEPCDQLEWITSEWSGCHRHECEVGSSETRQVICTSRRGEIYPADMCSAFNKPATTRTCVIADNCRVSVKWHATQWDQCSASCGQGTQRRRVFCGLSEGNVVHVKPDSECDERLRMAEQQECVGTQCTALWFAGSFGRCSLECGGGQRKRVVLCLSADTLEPVEQNLCDSTSRPANVDNCNMQPCATGTDDEIFLWPTTMDCKLTEFGCCPDGVTPAEGSNLEGCLHQDRIPHFDCFLTEYGCCPDGIVAAQGPNYKGCRIGCEGTMYGCCNDGFTAATGPHGEGCQTESHPCQHSMYGCCPDGITQQKGPNGLGCERVLLEEDGSGDETTLICSGLECHQVSEACSQTVHGCCPDGKSVAEGPDFEGCSRPADSVPCIETTYGCCMDGVTAALGPHYEGCPSPTANSLEEPPSECIRFEFGCCPDGRTPAGGPDGSGCSCDTSDYGCCLDGRTEAVGPKFEGCPTLTTVEDQDSCHNSPYGCCPDNVTPARGPHGNGCLERISHGARCVKPSEMGACGEYAIKWFFDAVIGRCVRDWYSGCKIDAHYFSSEEECQSVCVSPPAYDKCFLPRSVGRCLAALPRFFYNATSYRCERFSYGGCDGNTNNFETLEACEQGCEQPLSSDICTQPSQTGPCRGSFERFYYDAESSQCKPFIYGGCQGNENHFMTIEACEKRCKQPATHVCSLEKDVGPCRASVEKWFFNSQTGVCEQFIYGGCQGNDNRFGSEDECRRTCQKQRKSQQIDVCTLPKDPGPCKGHFGRWFYDKSDGRCHQFVYGGCQGNDNRFESEVECRTACKALPPEDKCSLKKEVGPCAAYVLRYYYEQSTERCEPFYYGGCGGNENNFELLDECDKQCTKSESEITFTTSTTTTTTSSSAGISSRGQSVETTEVDPCLMEQDTGPCMDYVSRYYYETLTGGCQQFWFGGCEGNQNNFLTSAECQDRCVATKQTPAPQASEPSDICSINQETGPCSDYTVRYYYSPSLGYCDRFWYGGCEGNGNNFETNEACEAQCSRTVQTTTPQATGPIDKCSQPKETGPCAEYVLRYGYDKLAGRCDAFWFGGCEGNGNNFETPEQCEAECAQSSQITTPSPATPDVCLLPMETGPCRKSMSRWYYDAVYGRCMEFTYGGCEGNRNRFMTETDCTQNCAANKVVRDRDEDLENLLSTDLCQLQLDQGMCDDSIPVWYYDTESGSCRRFMYTGCGGNDNRFEQLQQCEARCLHSERVTVPDEEPGNLLEPQHEERTCTDRNGAVVSEGEQYLPYSDPCYQCLCSAGQPSQCMTPSCRPPDCQWERLPDECCQFRCLDDVTAPGPEKLQPEPEERTCVDRNGAIVSEGQPYNPDADPCHQCICTAGQPSHCMTSSCRPPDCHWERIPDQCCQFRCPDDVIEPEPAKLVGGCPSVDECRLDCPFGFMQDSAGCRLCMCHQPCKAVTCSSSLICELNDVICQSALCPESSPSCHYEEVADIKLGRCPRSDILHQPGACTDQCYDDWQCSGDEKCCRTSCGGHMCMPASQSTDEPVEIKDHTVTDLGVSLGESVVMSCRQDASSGSGVIWYHDRSQIYSDDQNLATCHLRMLPNGSLELSSMTAYNVTTFTCIAAIGNDVRNAVAQTFILNLQGTRQETVTSPPSLSSSASGSRSESESGQSERTYPYAMKQPETRVGLKVQLDCSSRDNNSATMRWYKDGTMLHEDGSRVRMQGGVLIIANMRTEDQGHYMCEASADDGTIMHRTFFVGQAGALNAMVTTDRRKLDVGSEARLTCRVTDDTHGNVTIKWLRNGQPLPISEDGRFRQQDNSLIIDRVIKEDSAEFSCVVTRGESDVASSQPFKLSVELASTPAKCLDKPWYANCKLIVEGLMCRHPYFSIFCCKSCYAAGQLP